MVIAPLRSGEKQMHGHKQVNTHSRTHSITDASQVEKSHSNKIKKKTSTFKLTESSNSSSSLISFRILGFWAGPGISIRKPSIVTMVTLYRKQNKSKKKKKKLLKNLHMNTANTVGNG